MVRRRNRFGGCSIRLGCRIWLVFTGSPIGVIEEGSLVGELSVGTSVSTRSIHV
jgi:hypothetical protein